MAGGEGFKDMVLLDVTPLTLGIETTGGIMTPVVNRNQVRLERLFSAIACLCVGGLWQLSAARLMGACAFVG